MSDTSKQIKSIWTEIKETLALHLEYAKLTSTEKLTVLLSMTALALVCLVLSAFVIFLLSTGLMVLLARSTGLFGACMIMAGIYAVLVVLVIVLRRQLIIDPVARFVSHLILK